MAVVVETTSILEDRVIDDPPSLRGLRILGIETKEIAVELGVTPGRVRQFANVSPPTDSQLQALCLLLQDRIETLRWGLARCQFSCDQEDRIRIAIEAAQDLLYIEQYASAHETMPPEIQERLRRRYTADSESCLYDKLPNGTARIIEGPFGVLAQIANKRGPVLEDTEPTTTTHIGDDQ